MSGTADEVRSAVPAPLSYRFLVHGRQKFGFSKEVAKACSVQRDCMAGRLREGCILTEV